LKKIKKMHGQENNSPHIEGCIENVLVCAQFSSKLAHGTYNYA